MMSQQITPKLTFLPSMLPDTCEKIILPQLLLPLHKPFFILLHSQILLHHQTKILIQIQVKTKEVVEDNFNMVELEVVDNLFKN